MKILVAGGTGIVGRELCQVLVDSGHEVTVLTRDWERAELVLPVRINLIEWDLYESWNWPEDTDKFDAVINLAGYPVAEGRWTKKRKRFIRESRILSTRAIANAVGEGIIKPEVFVNASAIGYYGFSEGTAFSEEDTPGDGFLSEVCVDWENEASRIRSAGTRVVILRIGVV